MAALWAPTWKLAFDEELPANQKTVATRSCSIAPTDQALTFARSASGQVIGVTSYSEGKVRGTDLTEALGSGDPVDLFNKHGYDKIREAIENNGKSISISTSELGLPADFPVENIAVGTNYPEHAKDAGTVKPFLFPKIGKPLKSGSDVSAGQGLLDYEVELAVFPLAPMSTSTPEFLGLVLANDLTDRQQLFGLVDNDITTGKGFTSAKSGTDRTHVGNLVVIPRDWKSFVPQIELNLYVNNKLRQRSKADEMVWDVQEMIKQILARKGQEFVHEADGGKKVPMFQGDAIAPRTLILTGTPHGTIFQGVPIASVVWGLARFFTGGVLFGKGVKGCVIQSYCAEAHRQSAFLQPKDEILCLVPSLGEMASKVVA